MVSCNPSLRQVDASSTPPLSGVSQLTPSSSLPQIFRRDPLFHGSSNDDQLVKIAKVLGTNDLWAYLDKVRPSPLFLPLGITKVDGRRDVQYQIDIDAELESLVGEHPRKPWSKLVTNGASSSRLGAHRHSSRSSRVVRRPRASRCPADAPLIRQKTANTSPTPPST